MKENSHFLWGFFSDGLPATWDNFLESSPKERNQTRKNRKKKLN